MEKHNLAEVFTAKTKELIITADSSSSKNIDDIIRVREASDKSQKVQSILNSWATQQAQE